MANKSDVFQRLVGLETEYALLVPASTGKSRLNRHAIYSDAISSAASFRTRPAPLTHSPAEASWRVRGQGPTIAVVREVVKISECKILTGIDRNIYATCFGNSRPYLTPKLLFSFPQRSWIRNAVPVPIPQKQEHFYSAREQTRLSGVQTTYHQA